MDIPVLADQQEITFISSVWTLDDISRGRMIEMEKYIYIYIYKLSSQCPRTVGVDYSLHRIYEGNHINL